ncbi:hypothetical protein NBRC116494_29090 [Aurantivibrio plasticivorans]
MFKPRLTTWLLGATLSALTMADAMASASQSITVAARRLNESEYRHSITDIFGEQIKVQARFEPEKREEGLLALGNTVLSLTSSGFEQYFNLAQDISTQVLSRDDKAGLLACMPESSTTMARDCAEQFIRDYGEQLFRRPLSDAEVEARLETLMAGARQTENFYAGLELALSSLLVAPEFLFRIETAEPDPDRVGEYRLDAYSKASRLSYMFWNTTPDKELLSAAASGAIHTNEGVSEQINRLASSPRFRQGSRAFFADMLQLEGFANMVKDSNIYPKFNPTVADSAREQMLKTSVGLLVDKDRDYRELFSSNETYINRALASIYKVPYPSKEEWVPYTFPDELERAGILTQVGFLSLFSHAGTSSPTRRGIKIFEIFMCEPTPDPPADVDFSKVQALGTGTVRDRLLDHMENTGCTSCHKRSDPPGLALEHFDGLGQLRKYENGVLIDVSADLYGKTMVGAEGLADFLHDDERIPACLVRNVYAYGTGKVPDFWDEEYLEEQTSVFADQGYKFRSLMKQIASTPEFFATEIPEDVAARLMHEPATAQLTR